MTYSLVLPFHSDLTSIGSTTRRAREEGWALGIREVLLAHNGKPLSAAAQAEVEALVAPPEEGRPEVRFLDTTDRGIGAGYKLGIREAREEFVILSADDLPFGWSDVIAFERAGRPDFAMGSKVHPDSQMRDLPQLRRVSSFAFLTVRRLLLGRRTPGDSQGSLIIRTSVAKRLLEDVVYDHYLVSLELATFHLQRGGTVVEVPVVFEEVPHGTSVSLFRDGLQMAKEVIALRRRARSVGRR
jgi:dolichyl-phosphate beta-glucosyltransferase